MTNTTSNANFTAEEINDVYDVLSAIQTELFIGKSGENTFANFHYRTLEDIFSAVKPLLGKYRAALYFKEEFLTIGGRIYVNSAVHLRYKGEEVFGTGAAREEEMPKPKMSAEQTTNSAVTFARKSAISGLFLISENSSEPNTHQVEQYNNFVSQQANYYQGPQQAPSTPKPSSQPKSTQTQSEPPKEEPKQDQEQPKKKPSTTQRSPEQILQSGLRAAEEAGATQEQLTAWLAMDNSEAIKEIRLFVTEVAQNLQKANQASQNNAN